MIKAFLKTRKFDVGTSIEEKVRRSTANQEPLDAISPMIYTDSKNGVQPEFDIRTDRFDIALDAIDHYQASDAAKTDRLAIDNDADLENGAPEVEDPN